MSQLINLLLTVGMVVNMIILISLLRSRKAQRPKQILALIFVCIFFAIAQDYSALNRLDALYALSLLVADPIGFLVGPLFWVYLQSLSAKVSKPLRDNWQHFVPFGIYFLTISLPLAISYWVGGFWAEYRRMIEAHEFWLQLQAIYLLLYCWLSFQVWQRYRRNMRQQYAKLPQGDLSWVRVLLIGVVLTVSVNLILAILELIGFEMAFGSAYLVSLVLIGLNVYLWYYGSAQTQILIPDYLLYPQSQDPKRGLKEAQSHHLTNVSEKEIERLKQRLMTVLAEERPFLKEDLSLNQLATLIPTTDKKLSALLNHFIKQSFYDLINQYRVEEVKARLADPAFAHYSILGIAMECGFKSKSSFNRIFKKVTGRSPSAYKKEMSQ
ncbi:MAG: helix-turn-helix domain-containing protein [Bacteroidota bacterium]